MSELAKPRSSAESTTTNEKKNTWKLTATLSDIYGSTLYQFFHPETGDSVVPLLDHLEIEELKIVYTYEGKNTSSFEITGKLKLGSLPLNLNFNHKPNEWSFEADLAFNKEDPHSTTLGAVAANIFGPDLELPDFVADITLTPPGKDAAGLKLAAVDSTEDGKKDILFNAWVKLKLFSFQAIQYRAAKKEDEKEKPPAQRIFLLSIEGIEIADIDLIGKLPQPFDKLLFLYVQPQKGAKKGLTLAEVNHINSKLAEGEIKLQYKPTKKDPQNEDVVIPSGMHFIVLSKNSEGETSVVIDYVFGSGKKKKQKEPKALPSSSPAAGAIETTGGEESGNNEEDDDNNKEEEKDPSSAKAPFEKTIGPITISNLGLKVTFGKPSSLSVLMDASILLGPIGVGLLGFKLTLTFKDGLNLKNLPAPEPGIDGLAVSFDRSPVILGGMFKHVLDTYQGAATLSFKPYLFQAAGFYGTIPSKSGKFTSSFVYFILNGPLATLEFAEIRGVTGGFGYNTSLTFPTVTNVEEFPLINTPSEDDPKGALKQLTGGVWFFPRKDSFWLAAGLTILAFEILEVKAVIVIEWDPKIKLGLFGVATADLPAGTEKKFARVQLGIVGVVDFNAGILKIEGQLSPDSFVLDPSCHLTGGFGLFTWFGSNELAGDFVFTIGGYHRSYKAPSQYPNPPRLAISWAYDSSISIRGEAYFAITPKVCMGGGRLNASLTLGPLYAFFDAYADFLINYKPFHFTAEGGLSVGVRYTLDLWICTVHIGVELSATLYIEGPPVAGRVHVNFWVFGFDVNFGAKEPLAMRKLSLKEFFRQVLQADNKVTKPTAANDSEPPAHVFSCNQGLIPSSESCAKTNPNTSAWNVRGAVFQFSIGCKFAFKEVEIITHDAKEADPYKPKEPEETQKNSIFAKPMCLTDAITSSITVTISTKSSRPTLMSTADIDVPLWNKAEIQSKSVPTALWGKYDATEDPNNPSNANPNQNKNLLDTKGGSVALPMAIQVSSPLPVLSIDKIPAFDFKKFFIEDAGEERHFPPIQYEDKTWQAKEEEQGMWEKVRTQWDNIPKFGKDATEQAVTLWSRLSFAKWDLGGPGAMSWKKPNLLLNENTFDTLFLEAPRLGVVAA